MGKSLEGFIWWGEKSQCFLKYHSKCGTENGLEGEKTQVGNEARQEMVAVWTTKIAIERNIIQSV